MSPLDISVLLFFIVICIKAFRDSVEFWRRQDMLASASFIQARNITRQTPKAKTVRKPQSVTRTSVRPNTGSRPVSVPYRTDRINVRRSEVLPVPHAQILHVKRGADRQIKSAA